MGYFLGPFKPLGNKLASKMSRVFEKSFLQGALEAMHHTRNYPNIAHVEFDQFQMKDWHQYKSADKPKFNPNLQSDAGTGFDGVYDIMNFDRIQDNKYYIMIANAGDGNSNAGNELHFSSLDAIIGEHTGIPIIQSAITNPGLLKPSQWILFDKKGTLLNVGKNPYIFTKKDSSSNVFAKLILPKGGEFYLNEKTYNSFVSQKGISIRESQSESDLKIISINSEKDLTDVWKNTLAKWA
jgi:hypothetical protein